MGQASSRIFQFKTRYGRKQQIATKVGFSISYDDYWKGKQGNVSHA